jgi:hypothetical protein
MLAAHRPFEFGNARVAKKDTSDLCFGLHDRRRRSATVVAANGLSIW